jgi:dihydropteroate synthase
MTDVPRDPPRLNVQEWRTARRVIRLDRPIIFGIVNVTPDSFSDGGDFFSTDAAIEHGLHLIEQGADAVDIGGESTRPGAEGVSAEEESRRILPVVRGIRSCHADVLISVDTVKSSVARDALAAGADIVNDVSGFRLDPEMPAVCGAAGAGVVLMHSRGTVRTMASYELASYGDDPVSEVIAELREALDVAKGSDVATDCIVLDPGIGFAKKGQHSKMLLAQLPRLFDLGRPIMLGLSRKRVVGELSGIKDPKDRDAATLALNAYALTQGIRIFRVHDVRSHRAGLDAVQQLCNRGN